MGNGESERDPDRIIADIEAILDEAAEKEGEQAPYEELDPLSKKHIDIIRREAAKTDDEP